MAAHLEAIADTTKLGDSTKTQENLSTVDDISPALPIISNIS